MATPPAWAAKVPRRGALQTALRVVYCRLISDPLPSGNIGRGRVGPAARASGAAGFRREPGEDAWAIGAVVRPRVSPEVAAGRCRRRLSYHMGPRARQRCPTPTYSEAGGDGRAI